MQSREPGRLANYAMPLAKSRGRRYPEPDHPYRNPYERDRDRVIHSRAFRRLENKTQVFTRRYSDHFRTRLTHTLEVAQVSRTVARVLRLQPDLTEALALVHDVGHPPFGHAGEHALDEVMRHHGGRFDHNLHALRIVEQFERKYAEFPGLNLTFEVREGIIKHSRDYDPAAYPELAEYLLAQKPPVEAQLIDLADEIAYNCADLDDGYEARLLTVAEIQDGVPLFAKLYRAEEKRHPLAPEKMKFNEALRRLVDTLVTDLIEETRTRLADSRIRSVDQVRKLPTRVAAHTRAIEVENVKLKRFLQDQLYAHPTVRADRRSVGAQIAKLFEHYISRPRSMPAFHASKALSDSLPLAACDYIAGMTDNYFDRQYAAIFS